MRTLLKVTAQETFPIYIKLHMKALNVVMLLNKKFAIFNSKLPRNYLKLSGTPA